MYLLGYDIGSSSIKTALLEVDTGRCVASAFHPQQEMQIASPQPGWAEQAPDAWWQNLKAATHTMLSRASISAQDIQAIGISYQMHGLVLVDSQQRVLRPAIIWCDSRAASIGQKAFEELGAEKCLGTLLNSPGNFTASKLKWVKENEPQIYEKIDKILLPGDYVAMKMTGQTATTMSGLSEGIFWDFRNETTADSLLEYYGIERSILPQTVDTFSVQGALSSAAAEELGLKSATPVTYRAGDQPNNAFSLNVLNPGELAATAGTSGVVYAVSDQLRFDSCSRVNTFAHVNHAESHRRLGILLCVNGTGILNAWMKRELAQKHASYEDLNRMAQGVGVGSDDLVVLPFGNGAERLLQNREPGAHIHGLKFNTHGSAHLFRAAQEGIAFAFNYGMEIMQAMGVNLNVIRAGHANLFLSPVFRETLSTVSGATIEMYNTDGAIGAARGAGIGAKIYRTFPEAFLGLERVSVVEPDKGRDPYQEAYEKWKTVLNSIES